MAFFAVTLMSALMVAFASAGNITAANSLECCSKLHTLMPDQVIFPGSRVFDQANADCWSLTSVLQPSCIVQPTCADEVSTAVKILVSATDSDGSACPFAIKSGGYNPNPGANDIAQGISIDLSGINQVVLSTDRTYVSLGAGGTWLNAYETLNGRGVAIPGGRCGETGIGGLTLGGGISFHSPRVGFVADNVLNYEVVLASGQIFEANASNHSDLFMALKGGSSNFGIVTRIDLAAFDGGMLWGGSIVSPVTNHTTNSTLQAIFTLTEQAHTDEHAAYVASFRYNSDSKTANVTNTLVYTKDVAYPSIFSPATSIQPQLENTLRSTTEAELLTRCGSSFPAGYRDLTATVTIPNDPNILGYVHELTTGAYQTVQDVHDLVFTFVYEPLPRLYAEQGFARGGNLLGLNNTQEDLILVKLSPRWSDPVYDDRLHGTAANWVTGMQELFAVLGIDTPFVYLNYAGDFQDPLASYGDASMDLMKHVSTKYDPQGVFQNLLPGGFKLSNAA